MKQSWNLERVRSACPNACILLGSGITEQNASDFLKFADGVIVGSSLKRGGVLNNSVDPKRVARLARAVHLK